VFSSDRHTFWGAAGELKAFMDNGLFQGKCKADLGRKENLVSFELHTANWIDKLRTSNAWLEDTWVEEFTMLPSPKHGSSDDEIDEDELDRMFDDIDIGDVEDNDLASFDEYLPIETIEFGLSKKTSKASIHIRKRIESVELNLMQEYSKTIIKPVMEKFKRDRGSRDIHSSACFVAACCIANILDLEYERYLGDRFPDNMTYSDCFDPLKAHLFSEEEINNAERRYKRLKYTCIAYGMLTIIKSTNKPNNINQDTHYARNSLADRFRVPTNNVSPTMFDERYAMFNEITEEVEIRID